MLSGLWTWLREQTKAAILAGVRDAAAEINEGGEQLVLLPFTERPALPPPTNGERRAAKATR